MDAAMGGIQSMIWRWASTSLFANWCIKEKQLQLGLPPANLVDGCHCAFKCSESVLPPSQSVACREGSATPGHPPSIYVGGGHSGKKKKSITVRHLRGNPNQGVGLWHHRTFGGQCIKLEEGLWEVLKSEAWRRHKFYRPMNKWLVVVLLQMLRQHSVCCKWLTTWPVC